MLSQLPVDFLAFVVAHTQPETYAAPSGQQWPPIASSCDHQPMVLTTLTRYLDQVDNVVINRRHGERYFDLVYLGVLEVRNFVTSLLEPHAFQQGKYFPFSAWPCLSRPQETLALRHRIPPSFLSLLCPQ